MSSIPSEEDCIRMLLDAGCKRRVVIHCCTVEAVAKEMLSRITDVFFAIPLLLAAIVFMQMFKGSRSIFMVVIVLSMFLLASVIRSHYNKKVKW